MPAIEAGSRIRRNIKSNDNFIATYTAQNTSNLISNYRRLIARRFYIILIPGSS